jgi:protein transport protein SEC23
VAGASDLPTETKPGASTVEYDLGSVHTPATFVFAIDVSVSEGELTALKDVIEEAVGLLPPDARVGLVTFASDVRVYDLAAPKECCPVAFVFDGATDLAPARAAALLGFPAPADGLASSPFYPVQLPRFVAPVSDCEFVLSSILQHLVAEPPSSASPLRPIAATGVAMATMCGLLEGTCRDGSVARAMFFLGNPCTRGPGAVVGERRHSLLRSHADIVSGRAPLLAKAVAHYEMLATRFSARGHAVDLFASALDQVGLHEMQSLPRSTGGVIVLCDSFASGSFRCSLMNALGVDEIDCLRAGFAASLEVVVSRELRVCGAMGHISAALKENDRSSALASENEIGVGGTTVWRLGCMDPGSSYVLFFDVVAPHGVRPASTAGIVQLLTRFERHSAGGARHRMLRVTTVARPWAQTDHTDLQFDQDISAVVLARMAVDRCEKREDPLDVVRWLDRTLVKLVSKCAAFRRDDPASFGLPNPFSLFPRYMYNLRRGNLL